MNPTARLRWREIDALLAEALDRDGDERTAFLRSACGARPDLYHEVVALLAAADEAEELLGETAAGFAEPLLPGLREALNRQAELPPGYRVGPYRIERLIGRGGMGDVYLAERADGAFRKAVAIKLVRRGFDTTEVLARFRRERQLLAALDHPNIARLLDGGLTRDDRPYLVMEYVDGEPITAYCDRHELPLPERLELFSQIIAAVAHAHRHLVIHRDLKPSNILVSSDGTVKLLDFGIAKLLEAGDSQDDLHTRLGARRLTPEYAAPEQIRGAGITTATDVYGLGVLLYELTAGCRPIDTTGLAPLEREQALLHAKPPAPSAAVTHEAASHRGASASRLRRQLRGDIDTIVLKALRHDPGRRYGSVEALDDDLRRHVRGLPVAARPETRLYRTGRFVRRHRVGVVATLAIVVALAAGLAAATWQASHAAEQRDLARIERDKAQQVAALIQDLFDASNPLALEPTRLDTVRVRDFLAIGAEKVRANADQPPEVRAQMLSVIGRAYLDLGVFAQAEPLLEEALESRRSLHDPPHEDIAGSLTNLAALLSRTGDYSRAEELYREALEMNRELFGDEHRATAIVKYNLAVLLKDVGVWVEAETLHLEALATLRRDLGDEHPRVAVALSGLGGLLDAAGRFDEAEAALRESVELRRRIYGDGHPNVAVGLTSLGSVRQRLGDLDGAEAAAREALEIHRAELGHDHPHVAVDLGRLATILRERGDYEGAAHYYEESIALRRRLFGETSREMSVVLNNYTSLLRQMGAYDRAEEVGREALEVTRAALGEDHYGAAVVEGNLAAVLHARGDHSAAAPLYRNALANMRRTWPDGHLRISLLEVNLGNTLSDLGQHAEAEGLLLSGYEGIRKQRDPGDPYMVRAAESLASFYTARGNSEEAARFAQLTVADGP